MTKAQVQFLISRYRQDLAREGVKLSAHPFLSERDWSSPAKVNEFLQSLTAFMQFAGVRFEQARGLYRLTQNEPDLSTTFSEYAVNATGFVAMSTWSSLLSHDFWREQRPLQELNEIADHIVGILRITIDRGTR